jgi:chromosome segregation ATPase
VSERKEPTVSSVLDGKEELAERRARAAQQIRRSSGAAASSTAKSSVKQQVKQGGSSGFTWFVFLMTLCVGGAAAYALWQLEQAQKIMQDQRFRIVQLENKLAISDDSATQSLASVSAQVRELNSQYIQTNSEVTKLWATRNVNRDGIKAADEKVAVLNKKITGLEKETSNKVIKIEKAQRKIPALVKSINDVEASVAELKALEKSLLSTSQTVTEQDILLRAVRERVAVQSELLKTLGAQANKGVSASNKLKDIEKRLTETEEALTSLEAFRRTANRDLLQLKRP